MESQISHCLTLGGGMSIFPGDEKVPLFTLGGMYRLTDNLQLLTENWLHKGDNRYQMISAGIRCSIDRLHIDLAWMHTHDIIKDDMDHAGGWLGLGYVF